MDSWNELGWVLPSGHDVNLQGSKDGPLVGVYGSRLLELEFATGLIASFDVSILE